AVDPQYSDSDIWVVNDNTGRNRYPPRAGTDGTAVGTPLTAAEVKTILVEAFDVQRRARAQVRRPLDNRAQNTIVVVDTFGEVLGLVRGPDALVDAIDAVPQKARTTAFFSNPQAAADLNGNPDAEVRSYVQKFRSFIGSPNALTGDIAWSLRSIGNLARPFYPDGQVGTPPGPLSLADGQFSIFATGLQSRLITPDIVAHVNFILGASPTDVPRTCGRSPDVRPGYNRINNGLTLFAGGVPIYRGGQLVGAVASSGDGDDQSDMIAFLGLVNASKKLGGSVNVPSTSIRSDTLLPLGNRLTFIACPFAPFVGTSDQNVCQGF
ncbi:MAG TPA: heme-binding protein, partial [Sphingobium sp.]